MTARTDACSGCHGRRAVIPRDGSVHRAGIVAPVGYRLEAFERTLARRVAESHWDLSPTGHAKLRAQDVRMSLSCPRRDSEPFGDLDVRASFGDELYDLPLTLREPNAFAESDHARFMLPVGCPKRYWSLDRFFALNRLAYEGRVVAAGIDFLKPSVRQNAQLEQELKLIA